MKSSVKKNSLNEKLELILKNQEKILQNEKKILGEEEKIEKLENQEIEENKRVEQDEEMQLKELKDLEKEFRKNARNPIKNITKRDIVKGFIGAFIGVIGHFAFSKAADIAPTLDFWRSTILYIVAFIIIVVMLYYTGFRDVKKHIIFQFMPLRALTLYIVSIFTIFVVYFLFGKIHFPVHPMELYQLVGATIILAVIGAGTADLIGRNE